MGADLHLTIREPHITEEHMGLFFANTMGSKYFRGLTVGQEDDRAKAMGLKNGHDIYDLFVELPNVWIGEVSWLKAGLLDDAETYVPTVVAKVSELVGEETTITEDFIAAVAAALDSPNKTGYRVASRSDVIPFLQAHLGERVFTISW